MRFIYIGLSAQHYLSTVRINIMLIVENHILWAIRLL